MTAARLVFTTAPDAAVAEVLVRALVEERLAACGSILPGLVSLYRWEGEVKRDAEVMVLLKTAGARVDALVRRIAELHPYDVPEAVAVPIDAGLPAYLSWIDQNTEEVEEE